MVADTDRLYVAVSETRDHVRGPTNAPVTLVAYGDYECPFSRRLIPLFRELRRRLGNRLCVVYRHLPLTSVHPNAQRAAEAAEAAGAQGRFWEMHDYLYGASTRLDHDRLVRAAAKLGLDVERFARELRNHSHAARIKEDTDGARRSGASMTPTFFINSRRYDGPWDLVSLLEAIERPLGERVRVLAHEFASWAASGGVALLISAGIALVWANSPWAETYHRLWETMVEIGFGGRSLALSLEAWINDGLMALFFLVVGLEIKREILVGELAQRKRAALPVAAALGGMLAPATIYLLLNIDGPGLSGWGVPMATDIAFTLGVLALLGRRIPLTLTVFVSALAIADDLGAILVIALFYTTDISLAALGASGVMLVLLFVLNQARVYIVWPYALVGLALWFFVLASGVHATVAGVVLAMTIPTRSTPDPGPLLAQSARALRAVEISDDNHRGQAQKVAAQTLGVVVGRLESPSERLQRHLEPWTAYLILPLFALANAGVTLGASTSDVLNRVSLGILLGLAIGKPLGIIGFSWLAIRLRIADKADDVPWRALVGASCLCGIGFTMSMLIATAGFTDPALLSSAKLAVILASTLAGLLGWFVLRDSSPVYGRTRAAEIPTRTD